MIFIFLGDLNFHDPDWYDKNETNSSLLSVQTTWYILYDTSNSNIPPSAINRFMPGKLTPVPNYVIDLYQYNLLVVVTN